MTGIDRFKDKTDGQQVDPLEMLILNLTIHHLWGQVLSKYPQVRGRILVLTSTSPRPSSSAGPQGCHTVGCVSLTSFCPDGFIVIGVPIGTDVFVRNFLVKRVGLS